MRAVRLQQAVTGQIVSAPSIASFVRKVKCPASKRGTFMAAISNLLHGRVLMANGWGLPEVMSREVEVTAKNGDVIRAVAYLASRFCSATALRRHINQRGYLFRRKTGNRGRPASIRVATLDEAAQRLGLCVRSVKSLVGGEAKIVKGVTFVGVAE